VARRTSPTAWQVEAAPRVLNEGVPVAGALVQMRFQIAVPSTGEAFYVTCTTDASGTCPLVTWPVPYTDVTRVSLSVTMINSTPPTPSGSYPGTLCLQPDSPC
jgi:hypothetical protein